MLTLEELRTKRPQDMTVELAYLTSALVETARIAIESEQEERIGGNASVVLRLAGELGTALIEGCERSARESGRTNLHAAE